MFHKIILIIGSLFESLCTAIRACSSVLHRIKSKKKGELSMTETQRRRISDLRKSGKIKEKSESRVLVEDEDGNLVEPELEKVKSVKKGDSND